MKLHSHLFIIMLLIGTSLSGQPLSKTAPELRRFITEAARQGVAVDRNYFYVINNSSISKYSKNDGALINSWDGNSTGVTHLNSGVVIKGKLYCASSNYPETPMAGSVEIFDAGSLEHIGNHSFGIFSGSPVWIDRYKGCWYAGFAHYTGAGSSEGKDTRWTSVVRFDKKWRQVESWIFPANVINLFNPMSNSGATWAKNGKLYCTGHDKSEIYVMEMPAAGHTLIHSGTIQIPIEGQGIAADRSVKGGLIIYGIRRSDNQVIVCEIE